MTLMWKFEVRPELNHDEMAYAAYLKLFSNTSITILTDNTEGY